MTRYKFLLVAAILAVIPSMIFGWIRFYGGENDDYGVCVRQTTDNGYIIVGATQPFGEDYKDVWLVKTNENGDTLWTRTYDKGQGPDWGCSVNQTSDGGYFIAANAHVLEDSAFWGKIWLLKTDYQGDTLWTRSFNFEEIASIRWAEATVDGGYIVLGRVGNYAKHAFLLKLDANGDSVWMCEYANGVGSFVQQTSDGGYIITGTGSEDSLISGVWLLKTDYLGEVEWNKAFPYGGPEIGGNCVRQTSDGGYIITGSYGSWGFGSHYILTRTDENGDTLWTRSGGDMLSGSVQQTTDGGYIIVGYNRAYKIDADGNGLWLRRYDSGSCSYYVEQTLDGGYIITGRAGYPYDLWIVKTDEEGRAHDHEVSPVAIVAPEGVYVPAINPSVWFKSLGREAASGFYCHCEITGSLFVENTEAYYDSIWVEGTVAKDDTILVEFKEWMSYDTVGAWFDVIFYTTKEDDEDWGCVSMSSPFKAASYESIGEVVSKTTNSWRLISSCGSSVTLSYSDYPQGFTAHIFDASGRKVDELSTASQSGTVTWGKCYSPGVYFIRTEAESQPVVRKVVLIR